MTQANFRSPTTGSTTASHDLEHELDTYLTSPQTQITQTDVAVAQPSAHTLMSRSLAAFLRPNLERPGRRVRGVMGGVLLFGSLPALMVHWLLALALAVAGVFALFEAWRGWCLLRACGLKTRV